MAGGQRYPGPAGRRRLARLPALQTDTGEDLWQGGVYREIVPDKRLVFTFRWDESHEDGPPADTLVIVVLSYAPDGGTLMDFTHEGLKSEASLTGHKHGWTSTFERLEAFLTADGAK